VAEESCYPPAETPPGWRDPEDDSDTDDEASTPGRSTPLRIAQWAVNAVSPLLGRGKASDQKPVSHEAVSGATSPDDNCPAPVEPVSPVVSRALSGVGVDDSGPVRATRSEVKKRSLRSTSQGVEHFQVPSVATEGVDDSSAAKPNSRRPEESSAARVVQAVRAKKTPAKAPAKKASAKKAPVRPVQPVQADIVVEEELTEAEMKAAEDEAATDILAWAARAEEAALTTSQEVTAHVENVERELPRRSRKRGADDIDTEGTTAQENPCTPKSVKKAKRSAPKESPVATPLRRSKRKATER